MYFDIQMEFFGPDHLARQATELHNSHCESKKKGWDWDNYITLYKEHHATDHGYSGIDNGAKVHHFLQGIKGFELEATINVVQAQSEKYGK